MKETGQWHLHQLAVHIKLAASASASAAAAGCRQEGGPHSATHGAVPSKCPLSTQPCPTPSRTHLSHRAGVVRGLLCSLAPSSPPQGASASTAIFLKAPPQARAGRSEQGSASYLAQKYFLAGVGKHAAAKKTRSKRDSAGHNVEDVDVRVLVNGRAHFWKRTDSLHFSPGALRNTNPPRLV